MSRSIILNTPGRGTYEITEQIRQIIHHSDIEEGLCNLFVPHTSCSLMICENADPQVQKDLEIFLADLVQDGDPRFKHTAEGNDDMPAHIRSAKGQYTFLQDLKFMQKKYFSWMLLPIFFACTGCAKIAVSTVAPKKAMPKKFPLESHAKKLFWENLHAGKYERLPDTIRLLTAAYLANSNDPELAGLLGFAHIWVISERQRKTHLDPQITNHIILARKFFSDAVEMNPQDARLKGFYGVSTLIEGKTFKNDQQQTLGYFILQDAISTWPEFNYFTASYPMSSLPSDSKYFKQALEWQWKTLDVCTGTYVNRSNPNFEPYMKYETTTGKKRVCWNSWIAPHNFEGFFLNMGDMLVKSGDWPKAIRIYNNAKLTKSYASWKYRPILENRIKHAKANVSKFNQAQPSNKPMQEPVMMINSRFSCMACHQK